MKTQCTTGEALLQSPKAVNLEILDTTLNDQSILASSTMWVTFERNILYASDKLLIENGKEFTDGHIHYAQSMIKKQFHLLEASDQHCFRINSHQKVTQVLTLSRLSTAKGENIGQSFLPNG